MEVPIGIDLGTTYSCISFYNVEKNRVEIIPGKDEKRLVPSCVLYDFDGSKCIGEKAIKFSPQFPTNFVFDTKRIIGRKFSDPSIQNNIQKWPFTITKNNQNECEITITLRAKKFIKIRPEEIAAEILNQLKENAQNFLKVPITTAVITVPAYFTKSQRAATEDAARLANLKVLNLMSEPTAAALAYISEKERLDRTLLVYDLGGGTFDVSLVRFTGGQGEVIATDGHANLGGRDFDNNLVEYVLNECEKKYNLKMGNLGKNELRHFMRRLQAACIETKKELSTKLTSTISIDSAVKNIDIELEISRDKFNEINMNLFKKTIEIVDIMLTKTKITKNQINDVVLVGGSTRIKAIVDLLTSFFNGKTSSRGINPDEAVAQGAALQAARLMGWFETKEEVVIIHDSTPFSLGIAEGEDEKMDVLIWKNTKIPIIEENVYKTVYDNQTDIRIKVYEGEAEFVKDNIMLGEFVIGNVTPLKAGQVQVEVRFEVDVNNMLMVAAKETSKNRTKNLSICLENARYNKGEFNKAYNRVSVNFLK